MVPFRHHMSIFGWLRPRIQGGPFAGVLSWSPFQTINMYVCVCVCVLLFMVPNGDKDVLTHLHTGDIGEPGTGPV